MSSQVLFEQGASLNAINWMAAIAVGIALLLFIFFLWPLERKKRKEEVLAATSN